ncbi:MAG: hypothetical protein NZ898_11435 [Myxococcota bacterium]|nr:hypothetical protein [Myxococcota bacterium]MDW8361946.1 hypothetical protein [Myxococcales bacterium]
MRMGLRRGTSLLAGAIAALLVVACSGVRPPRARAQPPQVALTDLIPPGLSLVDVRIPERADTPVRLLLSGSGAGPRASAELLVDVLLAPDAAAARRALQDVLRAVQWPPPARPGLGEVGVADEGMAAWVRGPLLLLVRRVAGRHDAAALAERIDGVLRDRGPRTAPRCDACRATLPDVAALPVGGGVRVPRPRAAVALSLFVEGDVTARRLADGDWWLERTGPQPVRVRAVTLDAALRTHETVWPDAGQRRAREGAVR